MLNTLLKYTISTLRGYRIIKIQQKKQKKYYDGILINVVLFSLCQKLKN